MLDLLDRAQEGEQEQEQDQHHGEAIGGEEVVELLPRRRLPSALRGLAQLVGLEQRLLGPRQRCDLSRRQLFDLVRGRQLGVHRPAHLALRLLGLGLRLFGLGLGLRLFGLGLGRLGLGLGRLGLGLGLRLLGLGLRRFGLGLGLRRFGLGLGLGLRLFGLGLGLGLRLFRFGLGLLSARRLRRRRLVGLGRRHVLFSLAHCSIFRLFTKAKNASRCTGFPAPGAISFTK
ncbi:MAG TPA: hypothetical protein DEA08_19590 [Planctomycetes bacterium]|nr:hypothetical protein [Planctomycetota bacterium]